MSSADSSRGFGPAFDRDLAVARIEADRDAPGKVARGLLDERRIAHRGGADDDACDALLEPAFDGRHIADAAAELHRNAHRFEDAIDSRGVHRFAGKRAVEIDNVQILKALLLEGARLHSRIAMEDGRARHVALLKAHGEAFLEIDRGKENHGCHFRKLAISARPNRWLFSG